jgi:tetratricopeptide (TPR) repeat protein
MLLKWLNASDATEVGTGLADFVLQSDSGSAGIRRKADKPQAQAQAQELQKFLQKFFQRVDHEVRPLKLNLLKRAKLANSFKWRLQEQGVEQQLVDELTQALVLRLTSNPGGAASSDKAASGVKRGSGSRAAQALHARGSELLARGEFAEALECFQELVSADSRDAAARNGLGTALAQLARYSEAEAQFRAAIGTRPGFPEAHFNLAGVLQSTGQYHESEMPLRRALKLKPSYVNARISLGTTLVLLNRLQEARDCYEKALRVAPRNTQALVGMGQIETLEGRFTEAEVQYRRALEVQPNTSYAWAALVWLRKMTPADSAWLRRAEEIAASGLNPIDEATLRFAIGKYCDDIADFPRAFRSYQRANELHKLRAQPYNLQARAQFVDDLVKVYTPEKLARVRAGASDSARPVFVVGMPRSGTSLVEQIIASHPSAKGAGELEFWTAFVQKHETAIRQDLLAEPARKKVAQDYLRTLTGHSADALRVVDKAPVNSDYLGLIHSVYPNARMIYLQRDPIDTCLSCYFQQFAPVMNFTMDLSDLAHYYREHQRLVAHWRSVLPPETLLEVPYAELVADQEKWTRRILEFVGLPWDEHCLDFHKTVRAVTTASVWQVRQKIYKTSVERWRHYEKFIGPLRGLKDLA